MLHFNDSVAHDNSGIADWAAAPLFHRSTLAIDNGGVVACTAARDDFATRFAHHNGMRASINARTGMLDAFLLPVRPRSGSP